MVPLALNCILQWLPHLLAIQAASRSQVLCKASQDQSVNNVTAQAVQPVHLCVNHLAWTRCRLEVPVCNPCTNMTWSSSERSLLQWRCSLSDLKDMCGIKPQAPRQWPYNQPQGITLALMLSDFAFPLPAVASFKVKAGTPAFTRMHHRPVCTRTFKQGSAPADGQHRGNTYWFT